ncbi:hypothetical protein ALC56_11503 [Trachymyrmex septentrionalis]|uniref:Uncharacterized protein n=1 Tax=Trachymyrmex septentrionalis TaxID=34720 RepID=A0A195F1E4_9HYME|nr:hypothetical protein ALC56_11503 [Trachymyrmex septentrionalis]
MTFRAPFCIRMECIEKSEFEDISSIIIKSTINLVMILFRSIYVRVGRDLVDVDERGRAKRYHVQLVDEAGSPKGMAKERGNEGLYEGPMVYKLLTWHRPKKGEQEEKKKKEDEEKEIEEKGRKRERERERETVIYRAENVTGIAWHLLEVRKTEEKQTRRLSQVVALKGGLLMSVAFFRPPNHRVPEGSVGAHPTSTSPVEIYYRVEPFLLVFSEPLSGAHLLRKKVARDKITIGSNEFDESQIPEKRSSKQCRGETVVKIRDGERVYDRVQICLPKVWSFQERSGTETRMSMEEGAYSG